MGALSSGPVDLERGRLAMAELTNNRVGRGQPWLMDAIVAVIAVLGAASLIMASMADVAARAPAVGIVTKRAADAPPTSSHRVAEGAAALEDLPGHYCRMPFPSETGEPWECDF